MLRYFTNSNFRNLKSRFIKWDCVSNEIEQQYTVKIIGTIWSNRLVQR